MWDLSHLVAALAATVITLLATLIAVNLMGGEKRIEKKLPRLYDADDAEFRRALGSLLGPRLVEGNQVDVLVNGQQIFPAMLEAIAAARETISFETFIYWSGEIGERFVCALCERARSGVRVHVLLDWVGSLKMDEPLVTRLREAGVAVIRFHKPLEQLGPDEQSHSPQAARGGWLDRIHRRGRHCRSVAGERTPPGRVA
jgi:cardiolipin synthase